jgi:hypothetical protein
LGSFFSGTTVISAFSVMRFENHPGHRIGVVECLPTAQHLLNIGIGFVSPRMSLLDRLEAAESRRWLDDRQVPRLYDAL